MKSQINHILKEKIIRIHLSKIDLLRKVLKSVSQNNNIKNFVKIYTNYLKSKKVKKNNTISKKHKICLYTGKRSGVLKGFSFSRHVVKNMILTNKLTNLKQNNW